VASDILDRLRASNEPGAVQARYLLGLFDSSLTAALSGRKKNKRWASALYVVTVILSSAVTILLGIQFKVPGVEGNLKQIAFVIGAIVTLLNAFDPFFNYRGSWAAYDEALSEFYRLRTELEFYVSGVDNATLAPDKLDKLRDDHQAAWDRVQKAYRQSRRVSNPEQSDGHRGSEKHTG